MREIKFRAWDKEFKKFSDKALIKYSIEDINYLTDYEWSQYTGLKDIHGKEIYEGDILNVSKEYSGSFVPVYVLFDNGAFKVQVVHKLLAPFNLYENISIYEIVGNIYENPELMEKK